MRNWLLFTLIASGLTAHAGAVSIRLEAPAYPEKNVVLYRYLDGFTMRLERIAEGQTDLHGHLQLSAEVDGTVRAQLRTNDVVADLYLRAGSYHVVMPAPAPHVVRTIGGSTHVELTFLELDPLDVNALVSDLNTRLDAFLAENLATNSATGMDVATKLRNEKAATTTDTLRQSPAISIIPNGNTSRTDTFALKIRKFYASVSDPWFQSNVEYGLAGLYLGPRTDDRQLFARYLKDKPVRYDVPEYTRFFIAFYKDFLLRVPFRSNTVALQQDIKLARTDSLLALLARNDFLKDERIRELVLITGLYAQHANKELDRAGCLAILAQINKESTFAEHRAIAGNMLWDLTAMTAGTTLPNVGMLDSTGATQPLSAMLQGTTCLLVTTIGNPYSVQELAALQLLRKEYGGQARFICIALDRSPTALADWLRTNPTQGFGWYVPMDQQRLLDDLRIRSTPVMFLLQGNQLAISPAPLPSQGLGAVLHHLKAKEEGKQRLKPDRGVPPTTR